LLSDVGEIQEKTAKLQQLIKQEREVADTEAKKRDELNAAFKQAIKEYRELRAKRDEALKKAKELRDKKEVVYQELAKLHEQLKGREAELGTLRNLERQVQKLKEALEKVEWQYQTRSMPSSMAKSLEKEMEELEQKLQAAQKKLEAYKQTLELKNQYEQKLAEFRALKEEFRKTVSELDELRAKAAAKLAEAKKIKEEADKRHQSYIEHANQVIKLQAELNALRMQLQEVRKEVKQKTQFELKNKNTKMIAEKIAKAREKLSRGEKLEFEEWQALLLGDELLQKQGA
jgi:uncharacterized coiled-coil DUF342 family protein